MDFATSSSLRRQLLTLLQFFFVPPRLHDMLISTGRSNRSCRRLLHISSGKSDGKRLTLAAMDSSNKNGQNSWLDEVLLSHTHDDDDDTYIFRMAAMVVDYVLESSAGHQYVHPLRRISAETSDRQSESMGSTKMFEQLFGPCDEQLMDQNCVQNIRVLQTGTFRTKRINLKLTLAYRGLDFCGWEDQRHALYRREKQLNNTISSKLPDSQANDCVENNCVELPSVQGTLVDIIDPVFGDAPRQRPIGIKVAGRTDAGVSAIAQICRFRTHKSCFVDYMKDSREPSYGKLETFVSDLVNNNTKIRNLGLRVTNVMQVADDFHPTFGASCRAYVYLIDLKDDAEDMTGQRHRITKEMVPKLDKMLRTLEGKALDFVAFSYGKVKTQTTICTLIRARACISEGNWHEDKVRAKKQAICIELVGDRFLRRMVRILVSTALRETWAINNEIIAGRRIGLSESEDNALLDILNKRDRSICARPAPPDGLIFVSAGYSNS